MLTLSAAVRIFLALQPIDLHLSFDRLAGLVRSRLGGDPLSGDLFVFFNKSRTKLKILLFDRSGFVIYYRRLERGSFQLPTAPPDTSRLEVDPALLAMILEGIDLSAPRRIRFQLPSSKNPP